MGSTNLVQHIIDQRDYGYNGKCSNQVLQQGKNGSQGSRDGAIIDKRNVHHGTKLSIKNLVGGVLLLQRL
jgi:hypothetical protein